MTDSQEPTLAPLPPTREDGPAEQPGGDAPGPGDAGMAAVSEEADEGPGGSAATASPPAPGASADDTSGSPAPELARLADTQTRLLEELGQLREAFSLKIKFDEAKERAIATLSEEVQRHRQGLHFSILRPLFLDLITLYDDLLQCADAAPDGASATRTFQSLADTVEEILARNGVSAFSVESDAFDGKRQRAVRTGPTADPAQGGRVAQRLRRGFAHDERVVRPEHVSVYRFEAQDTTSGPAAPDPDPTPHPSA